jgi:hypothetical protein
MADIAIAPLAGAARAFKSLSGGLRLVLLNGRSVTPDPLVGTMAAIAADVLPVAAVVVPDWTATVNAGTTPPRIELNFGEVPVHDVPQAQGPVTGVAVFIAATDELAYHVQLDEANEVETTGGDVLVSTGSAGLVHVRNTA